MDISGFALITGAASGIGKQCVLGFIKEGAAGVALLDLNGTALETVKAECDQLAKASGKQRFQTLTYTVNVTDEDAVDAAVTDAAKTFGRLDYVVNCAGIPGSSEGGAAFAKTPDWQRLININMNGTFYTLKSAAKIMLKQDPIRSSINGRALQRGSIVNLASVLGLVGNRGSTAYTMAKHAVVGLTKTAALDYAQQGVRINAVCAAFVNTPLVQDNPRVATILNERVDLFTPMKRLAEPEEIADAVLFLSGGRSSYITGSSLVVDGGYTCH